MTKVRQIASQAAGSQAWTRSPTPAAGLLMVAASCLPAMAAAMLLLGLPPALLPAPLAFYAAGTGLALAGLVTSYPHPTLGACNAVTQVRLAFAGVLSGVILAPGILAQRPFAVFAIAVTALALDGLDGWLARRAGLCSAFGARFDMEVDAALGAVLALILLRAGEAEGVAPLAALLVLGFSRYAFVAAALALPWLRGELPPRFSRKAVCVIQIGTLAGLLLPISPEAEATAALAAAGLLVWSFARDVAWLARTPR